MGSFNHTYTYTNNRKTGDLYDADGRLTRNTPGGGNYIYTYYDVAGRMVNSDQAWSYEVDRHLDGNGSEVKREKKIWLRKKNRHSRRQEEAAEAEAASRFALKKTWTSKFPAVDRIQEMETRNRR